MSSWVTARVLVLFAHPALERSRVQTHLFAAAQQVEGVSIRDLYELYPDLDIDVPAEQAALEAHDVIIMQHPLHWYSAPPILKQWQDLVLEHDWAYGKCGTALRRKLTFHVVSAGGRESAYRRDGMNRFTLSELLRPFEATAHLCGLRWLPPYAVHGTHALAPGEIETHARAYRRLLEAVRDERFDLERAASAETLHGELDALIVEGVS